MYLESLELQGFKSFPDKTVLTFERGITGVVGPNGSGKSNIGDAIRWVLGEQSSKSLRGTKMEDVIFSGTRSRSSLSFAKVSLTLNNKDRSLQVDSDQVVITRKYYRSGESEYLINQQNVRLRDIHELLMDTGLGRDGYAIVGQGRVADLISAKSSDRREIFEEAAGISKYRYRKEEAQKRLNLAEENLVRLRDILGELESRVGPLKQQSEKAHKYLELAQRRKEIEINIWDDTLNRSQGAVSDIEKKLYIANTQIEGINNKIGDKEKENESLFLRRQEAIIRIDELNREKQNVFEEISSLRAEIAVVGNDITHAKESIAQMQEMSGETEQTRKAVEDSIKDKEFICEKLEQEAVALRTDVERLQEELLQKQSDEEGFSGRIAELSEKISAKSKVVSDYKVQSFSGQSAIEEILSALDSSDERSAQSKTAYERQSALLEQKEAELKKAQEDIASANNSREGAQMIVDMRRKKMETVQGQMQELQNTLNEQRQKLKILRDLENSMENFAYSVRNVIKESKNGRLRGIHGAVSQIISVEEKHAVAIETALGAAMQHVVVDSEEAAKRAIAFLKETKGGRATFLPITSVRGRDPLDEPLETYDSFIGVASELVSCDEKYAHIISNLLSRTAVVEDIDSAVRIAKKYSYRFRIVTLDGQIVNAGGSMTGGSLSKNNGVLSRGGQIRSLEENIAKNTNKLNSLTEDFRQRKEEFDVVNAQLEAVLAELKTAQEDERSLSQVLESVKFSFVEAAQAYKRVQEERESSEIRLAQLRESVEKSEASYKDAQIEVEALSAQLQQLTGRSNEISREASKKSEMLSECRFAVIKKENEISAVKNEIALLQQQRENTFLQDETMAARISEAEISIENLNNKIKELNGAIQQKEERVAEIESDVALTSLRRDDCDRMSKEIGDSIKSEMEEREDLSREVSRLAEQKLTAEKEYDSIISSLWEEYEMTRSEAAAMAAEIGPIPNAKQELVKIRNSIKGLGHVNVGAIDEYKEVSERYTFMKEQTDDVEKSKAQLLEMVNELTGEMRKAFMESFVAINKNFARVFAELFGGGTARLSLSDPDDVLESGIEIAVEPPGKIIKNLAALSGGEQAFVAISIYFAILAVRPSPFCVLDEIEAALDDVNVYKYASYLRKMNHNTQFIAITHRRGTMEEADVLYGVTMQEDGISKILQLKVDEIEERLGMK